MQHLTKSHPLTWVSQFKTTPEEDELPLWMSIMKDDIDVLVTQFQQMYMSCHHSLGATRVTLNTQMPPLRRPAAESNDFNPQTERKWWRTGCDGPSRPSK